MLISMLLPRSAGASVHDGHFELVEGAGLSAPPAIADLARELLPLPTTDGDALTFRIRDDPALGAEGYHLRVTPEGVAATAATEDGLRWAVQSLLQLVPDGAPRRLPCLDVVDRPVYPWRGSLLDVARWCHPVPFLYRYVDLLAMHKLNTLHLHLTDDQGWRFEVRKYPRLTEVGGHRRESPEGHAREGREDGVPHGGFYTQRELSDLVAYAARRGVRIMPEIDLPGHTQAAIAAYPELGNVPSRQLETRTTWGISTHILNLSDATISFVLDVLDEVVDVFPFEYVHIGGDEVPAEEWRANPDVLARAAELGLDDVRELQGWFAGRLADHLGARGRKVGIWDELVDRAAPPGATVFAWQAERRVRVALDAGHPVVAAPQSHTYLDWAETVDDPDEPLAINGPLPLEKVYDYHPDEGVIGVQGQLWSEYLPTTDLVEWRAYPRLAALAELGWSGPGGDFGEFRQRLAGHLGRLDRLGVRYRPLG
ncbi:beta-N-acetylhexosaminidase [Phytohabitans suffuscus]|uniref:beta-N-acetylhexosaminidase n=2 Tax=Phytohabitans suffuscus TaxID=624315 RepID=A0A6F8YQI5_9ACTN|nr:beta-N-acetylhexosaminidase [Phytohabitans suffuscus]